MTISKKIIGRFPSLSKRRLRKLLTPPLKRSTIILDTDAANEIDDQFALAWTLLSSDKIDLLGITAAPYSFRHLQKKLLEAEKLLKRKSSLKNPLNKKENLLVSQYQNWINNLYRQNKKPSEIDFVSTEEGMTLSYEEILRVLAKMKIKPKNVFQGSPSYLTSLKKPQQNPAVEFIIKEGLKKRADPLYLNAIGCPTNIASALLLEPKIINNITIIWTAAYPSCSPWNNSPSLNLVQDPLASRLLFESGAALVYLPGYQVGEQLTLSFLECQKWIKGRGAIGDYLYHLYTHNPIHKQRGITGIEKKTWVIWDLINIAWLINSHWVSSALVPTPILSRQLFWKHSPAPSSPPLMREAYGINRDEIFMDIYKKLEDFKG